MRYKKEELIKPFYFPGGDSGILLIHGFTACPIDLKPLGEKLNSFGHTVSAPLLAGHGSSPEEMRETTWKEWTDSVLPAFSELREKCQKVAAVGHSMGGLIALWLAGQRMVDGIVSINAPIIYRDPNLHFADRLLGKQEYVDKPYKESEISVTQEGLPHFSYMKVPVASFVSFNNAIPQVQNELRRIVCPALVVQCLKDSTVHPRSGRMIKKSMKHRQKEITYWADQDHYLPLGSERDRLAEKIRQFLEKYSLGKGNRLHEGEGNYS
ncbi:MAG: Carboxylesterase [Candidatus Dichloromethanomonas elyunquensis]|nr:MAG: Carboxylesterase [Candidatus Dichloromethanomonas elyunquensis]